MYSEKNTQLVELTLKDESAAVSRVEDGVELGVRAKSRVLRGRLGGGGAGAGGRGGGDAATDVSLRLVPVESLQGIHQGSIISLLHQFARSATRTPF